MNIRFAFLILILSATAISLSADDRDSLRFILRHNPVPRPSSGSAKVFDDASLFDQTSELKLAGAALVRFYQAFISPQDASACPFDPTCSEYAKRAVLKYGLIAGAVMAADRYQRCNGLSARFYPRDPATGRLIDPP
jgi:putative membrane protein insertion efficiency factor